MGTRKPEVGAKRSPSFFRTFELVPRGENADGPATARLAPLVRVRRRTASSRFRLGEGRKSGLLFRRLEILTVSGQTCQFGKVPRRKPGTFKRKNHTALLLASVIAWNAPLPRMSVF